MFYHRKRQQGNTLITWTILLTVVGFFVLLILKIAPIYMNHSKIELSLAALEEMENLENQTTNKILNTLDGRFNINYVEHFSYKQVKVLNRPNYVKVIIEYEVVEPIVGNLSVLVEFYEELEVEAGEEG